MDSKHNEFSWWALGGLGEVGMNCMTFRFGDTYLPVDAGLLFADENDFGIDSIHPEFRELLHEGKVKDWIITHGHEDHIGAVAAVLSRAALDGLEPPRFLCPPFAAALIRERLKEEQRYPRAKEFIEKICTITVGEDIFLGPLRVRFVETRHSIPDACSIFIEWIDRDLRLFHSADFKIDENVFEDGVISTDHFAFAKEKGLDFLFVDSTNSEREGHSRSELEIIAPLEKLVREAKSRVYVTLFSSNVYRIAQLMAMAGRLGRRVCLAGRSMQTAFRLAQELGIHANKCPDFSKTLILDPIEISRLAPEKQFIICSGSQGEQRSVLQKMSTDQHADFHLEPGDTVIFSSKTIPGNEKGISRLVNALLKTGASVYWEEVAKLHAGGPIHASGHARRDEIKKLMRFLEPKHVIPVHGELRQLMSCGDAALEIGGQWGLKRKNVHVLDNNIEITFSRGASGWELSNRRQREPVDRVLRFENFACHSRDAFLWDRKRAARGGVLSVSVDSLGRANLEFRGLLPEELLTETYYEKLYQELDGFLFSRLKTFRKNNRAFQLSADEKAELSDELSRFVRRICGVRPLVILHFVS